MSQQILFYLFLFFFFFPLFFGVGDGLWYVMGSGVEDEDCMSPQHKKT
jgi:hypothetical protein